eukprot:TRINITY_DN6831_c0_g1_i1.p1 TRINITY_DN6831_c0_g1~~TRINITY_DN6831_c0_g1_i1.p1  ORF type:complete len:356 (+),score=60.81 TRINITY_DN6831_c0_g1_i1:110-1069(+)
MKRLIKPFFGPKKTVSAVAKNRLRVHNKKSRGRWRIAGKISRNRVPFRLSEPKAKSWVPEGKATSVKTTLEFDPSTYLLCSAGKWPEIPNIEETINNHGQEASELLRTIAEKHTKDTWETNNIEHQQLLYWMLTFLHSYYSLMLDTHKETHMNLENSLEMLKAMEIPEDIRARVEARAKTMYNKSGIRLRKKSQIRTPPKPLDDNSSCFLKYQVGPLTQSKCRNPVFLFIGWKDKAFFERIQYSLLPMPKISNLTKTKVTEITHVILSREEAEKIANGTTNTQLEEIKTKNSDVHILGEDWLDLCLKESRVVQERPLQI